MKKINFYDSVENALNIGEESEEEMVAEYIENELITQEYEDRILKNLPQIAEKPSALMHKISDYLVGGPCCDKNCCESWSNQDLEQHMKDLTGLSKYEKKIVLLTVLRNCLIYSDKTRYSEHRQRIRFNFSYAPFGSMCANAFRLLFDIRIETFKGLLAHLKTNAISILPPVHGNKGKKADKSNLLSNKGISERVIKFLLELGNFQGEYSAGRRVKQGNTKEDKNPDFLWLPACFTRSILLRMYKQQFPDDSISRTAFCLLLKNDSKLKHIQIRSPRTDMCDFCEFQKRKIAGIKPHDETKAEKLVEELKAHQDSYRSERNLYNSEREQSKKDRDNYKKGSLRAEDCIEHISIDYAQSIDVPHTTDQLGGTFYLHMRKFFLFCVCSVLEDRQYCYTYDEREAGKGANEVISFLHNFLANRKIKTSSIRIHADNCAGQNKNKYVLWYLSWLVASGRLKRIEIKFMIKGHTHCIVDSGIGHTKRQLRRSNVFCLEHWKDVINQSAVTNQAIIVNGNDVYDWKQESIRKIIL